MILTKLGHLVNEMMVVAMTHFQNFLWSHFLIIRQNVNIATNAILNSGLTPLLTGVLFLYVGWSQLRWLVPRG